MVDTGENGAPKTPQGDANGQPSAMPPAAITGTATEPVTFRTRSSMRIGAGNRSGVNVPECPPAAAACTASMSAPAATAASASGRVVTVCTTTVPALRSAVMTSLPGSPKVKLTTGTGSVSSMSTFAPNASSSSTGAVGNVRP